MSWQGSLRTFYPRCQLCLGRLADDLSKASPSEAELVTLRTWLEDSEDDSSAWYTDLRTERLAPVYWCRYGESLWLLVLSETFRFCFIVCPTPASSSVELVTLDAC